MVDNPGEKLKNNMYVTATVNAGVEQNAIAVPDASVLRDDENQPFVYVATGSNQFGAAPVEIGQSEAGKTQILKGLSSRRQSRRRRQLVPAVRQFVSTLRRPISR